MELERKLQRYKNFNESNIKIDIISLIWPEEGNHTESKRNRTRREPRSLTPIFAKFKKQKLEKVVDIKTPKVNFFVSSYPSETKQVTRIQKYHSDKSISKD